MKLYQCNTTFLNALVELWTIVFTLSWNKTNYISIYFEFVHVMKLFNLGNCVSVNYVCKVLMYNVLSHPRYHACVAARSCLEEIIR